MIRHVSLITIQSDYDDTAKVPTVHLRPGEEVTFGRGFRERPADIPLDDPAVSKAAGIVRAVRHYWEISNLSTRCAYVVDNLDAEGRIRLSPGTLDAPIPFERSRVRVPGHTNELTFLVLAPGKDRTVDRHTGRSTAIPYPLDPETTHFLVLVALCEPQLLDPTCDVVPTVTDLQRRMPGLYLSRTGVDHHINFLAITKFGLTPPGRGKGVSWKPQAIVRHALQFSLVTKEHLALLP